MARKVDNLVKAQRKATAATNLFAKAAAELEGANEIIDTEIESANGQIATLKVRVEQAQAIKKANESVTEKLKDFVPAV